MRWWPWQPRQDLDERLQQARRKAEESLRRLEHDREHVIGPLRSRAGRNEFADLIRTTLHGGPR